MEDKRTRLVATGPDDAAIGFVDVEADGHVDLLYVDPRSAGGGVGRALLQAAIDLGHPRLFAEASEVALPLFERMGFVIVSRRDLTVGGVAMHNWAVGRRRP
jgi:putative acetyltransferase